MEQDDAALSQARLALIVDSKFESNLGLGLCRCISLFSFVCARRPCQAVLSANPTSFLSIVLVI